MFRPARPKKKQRWMKRAGKKVKAWDAIRRVLNIRFLKAGITRCEVGLIGCWRSEWLGHAHYDKRRFLTPAELWITILACSNCHSHLEILPRPEMKKAVLAIIAKRTRQP